LKKLVVSTIFLMLFLSGCKNEESKETIETKTSQKSGTISDNQGSSEGFKIDTSDVNYKISYSFNDSTNYTPSGNNAVFTMPGKYDFIIESQIGVTRKKTVYIHEKGNEKNIEIYFGGSLFSKDSKRVFDPSENYPVYVKDQITIKTENENRMATKHAPLVGKIYLVDDFHPNLNLDDLDKLKPVAEKNAEDTYWSFSNLPAGKYEAVFANNEDFFKRSATGDTVTFVWRFYVVDEGYTPTVNEDLLYRLASVNDFKSLHYVVKLKTQGTGNLLVVFDNEYNAYNFASKYLASTVIKFEDKFIFNEKEYSSEKVMLESLHAEAKKLVEKII